jgi:hypothetical protein
MKKLYFLLFMLGIGQLYGQAILNQTIPATLGANSALRAPSGLASMTTIRAHYMIYPGDLTALPIGAQITTVGFVYINGTDVAAGGNIKFYMENSTATSNTKSTTWATAITGMDSVYDGPYSIPVSTTPTTSTITLSDTFVYAGSGIQIAFDYLGTTFSTVAALYDCNNSVASDLKLITSATSTPGTTLTGASSWRPGIYIGYINPFTNDMTVDFLFLDQGHHNKVYNGTQTITGTVRNKSQGALTSIPVTLDITGANPSTTTQTIPSLAAGASQVVSFTGLNTANSGIQSITLSVPSDQFTANDSLVLTQSLNCDTISYADNSVPNTSIGFNTAQGILAAKHSGSTVVNSSVKTIYFDLSNDTRNTGNQIQGILLDSGGVIIDTSAAITVTAAQLGTRVSFPLTGNNLITTANPDYYIGVRQYINATTGYFPISSNNPSTPLTDRFFGFAFAGGIPSAPITTLGTLAIGATVEVEPITLTSSDPNDSICAGESVTLIASGTSSMTYDFMAGGTSVQNSASTTYMGSPSATSLMTVEGSINSCPILSNSINIVVVSIDTSASKTNDSTGTANMTGATYQWIDCGTGMAISGATSRVYTATAAGNYQVAVTMAGCTDTSICLSLTMNPLGIGSNEIKSLAVYPSPADNFLVVETENISITALTIFDVNGKLISNSTPQNSSVRMDVSNLKSGVYLLKIETANGNEVRRFIKQ